MLKTDKKNLLLIFLSLIISQALFAKENMIFAIDIIRHGDRTPLHTSDKIAYTWTVAPGELTPKGMEQHYHLGQELRKRYIDQEKLLTSNYQPKHLYVRSTDLDRTLMSAQSLLIGLYPIGTGPMANGFQPIPIHTQPKDIDPMLLTDAELKQFNQLLDKQVYTSQVWLEKTKQTQPKWRKWSAESGFKINHLKDVIRLGNVLYITKLYEKPLPSGLSQEDVSSIIEISESYTPMLYQHKTISDLLGTKELKLIREYVLNAVQKKNDLKYVLLSGHDTSILCLMSTLKVPLSEVPPYAAHLSFALYENDAKKQHIAVRYNDKIINLPGCDPQGCTIFQFNQLGL